MMTDSVILSKKIALNFDTGRSSVTDSIALSWRIIYDLLIENKFVECVISQFHGGFGRETFLCLNNILITYSSSYY
jgi:hypothetical protein